MEIQDILMASADNMRSAVAIKQTVEAAQRTMLNRFFAAVDAKVGVHYKRLENEYDYAYHNGKRVEDFYKYRRYTMPGISYLFQENVKPGVDLWVRLEIYEYSYLGYYCPQECIQGEKPPLTAAEVKQLTGLDYKEDGITGEKAGGLI